MARWLLGVLAVLVSLTPLHAHFIWIVPIAKQDKVQIVFSDTLGPDDQVPIAKIGATKLQVRNAAGKVTVLDWTKEENAYLTRLPGQGPSVLGGVCRYGVIQRGDSNPFLLNYYAKLIQGKAEDAKAWDFLPLEIVALGEDRFRVTFNGKPAGGSEIVVLPPAGESEKLTSDAQGEFKIKSSAAGVHGIRARHIEAKPGELDGKKYDETRHYATLVFARGAAKAAPTPKGKVQAYPSLPRAVSSLGADIADGWLYIYGGHCAKTHEYSTEAVVGTFHRLKLSDPQRWEELPGGPPAQGLALVAHEGKLYRIGGMQPRNLPNTGADNHSLASCARFDPATKKWEALPDLPAGRSSHDAVVVGDKLIVVGGWKLNGTGKKSDWYTDALVLDLSQKASKWQSIKQPFQRRALTAATFENKVYVIGGIGKDGSTELTVNIYDPVKDTWATGPDLPGGRRNGFSPAASVAGGRLYVSAADGKVVRLNTKRDAWEEVGDMKQPRIVHRMVAVGPDCLLAVGGALRGSNIDVTEAINVRSPLSPAPRGE